LDQEAAETTLDIVEPTPVNAPSQPDGESIAWRLTRVVLIAVPLAIISYIAIIWVVEGWGPGDATVYLAAGERLNAGHQLYALVPGDRDVVLHPPYWTVPLLSPPLIAVIWMPLAALPLELGLAGWWAGAIASGAAILAALYRRIPRRTGLVMLALAIPFAVLVGSGNLDVYRLGATILVWRTYDRRPLLAGGIVGILTAIKLTPGVLVLWFLVMRQWRAALAAIAAGLVATIIAVLIAGLQAHLDYLSVVTTTFSVGTSADGLAGWARIIGVDPAIARLLPSIGAGCLILAMVRFANRPGRSFVLAVLASTVGGPASGNHTWANAIATLAPSAWPKIDRQAVQPVAGPYAGDQLEPQVVHPAPDRIARQAHEMPGEIG
jgi:hypothetical protein